MSVPRQRNPDPVPAHTPAAKAERVQVGDRRDGGQVSASLARVGGEPRVKVGVAHLTGLQVDISLDAAAQLRDGLTALLEQAGWPEPSKDGRQS